MNTDTPRTDAAKQKITGYADEWVPRYVAEELERELNHARTLPDYSKMDTSYGASVIRDLLGLQPHTPLFGLGGQLITAVRDLVVERNRLKGLADVAEELERENNELNYSRTFPDYSKMNSSYGAGLLRMLLRLQPHAPVFGPDEQLITAVRDLKVERDKIRTVAKQMAEILEELAKYPVARGHPDGPCLDRQDMRDIEDVLDIYYKTPREP